MMKTIGIKLADGTFYPVLKEDTPLEKNLDLTTVHNNQTKVMVDIYRSEACKMLDAEYVESLQIENLIAHPEGEPDIAFTISVDKDKNLSAKIKDLETGNQNSIEITLVARPEPAVLNADDMIEDDSEGEPELAANGVKILKESGPGLLVTADAIRNAAEAAEAAEAEAAQAEKEDATVEEETPAEEIFEEVQTEDEVPVEEEPLEVPAAEEIPVEVQNEEEHAENITEETIAETLDEALGEDFSEQNGENMDDLKNDDEEDFSTLDIANMDLDLPDISESGTEEPDLTGIDLDLPDFAEVNTEDTAAETPAEDTSLDLDLPDFPEDETSESDSTADTSLDLDLPDFPEDNTTEEPAASEDTSLDLDLPDFPEDTSAEEDSDAYDLNLPDFESDETAAEKDDSDAFSDFDIPDPSPAPAAAGFDFAGLYDDDATLTDEGSGRRRTKLPLIICIICAIICILATAAVLFVIPSRYNLLTRKAEKQPVIELAQPVQTEQPEHPAAEPEKEEPTPEPEPEPEPVPAKSVPSAREDEIVIIEKAEEVVPEQPPVKEEKPKNIIYKIKWGDTLWDIADTYYKNPWRYKDIAKYNGIKDPDHIISGTIIEIPAE